MVNIVKYNTLTVIKEVDFGVYLDGEQEDEILMPTRYVPKNCKAGDFVDVFLYLDSEDRPIATTEKPFAQVGEFSMMRVKSINKIGFFGLGHHERPACTILRAKGDDDRRTILSGLHLRWSWK